MTNFPTGPSIQAANVVRQRQSRRRLQSSIGDDAMGGDFADVSYAFRQRPRATPSTPTAPAAQPAAPEPPRAAARRQPGGTMLDTLAGRAASVMGSERVQERIGQRNALGLNQPGGAGSVNPSAPALLARGQRESRLRDNGIDPTMLRQELERRRTTDAALIRQRRALGRKAQLLEAQGDRVGSEQVRAEIELLEGSRREAAGMTARSSALIRGGESRLQDAGTIAMIRRNQDVTRRRDALGDQAEDLDLTIAGRGLEARDLTSQAGLSGARLDQREAGLRDTLSERTLGTRTDAGVLDAENELASLRAQEGELADAIRNGQGDREAERELRRVQLQRERAEAELAGARAGSELDAERATGPARVDAATDAAAVNAIRARQERERLEGRADDDGGQPIVRRLFGDDIDPTAAEGLVAEVRAPVEQIVSALRPDLLGTRAAGGDALRGIESAAAYLDARRAILEPTEYAAIAGYIRDEVTRAIGPGVLEDANPFRRALSGAGIIGTELSRVRVNRAWNRLRQGLGIIDPNPAA